tara:strand:+ start:257 stop:550 length:294 start_codon:yes stop_codon:yes gene_type:complete
LTVVKPDKSGTTVVKNELVISESFKLENSNKIKNNKPPKIRKFIVLNEIFSKKSKFFKGKKIKIEDEIKKLRIVLSSRLELVNKNNIPRIATKEVKR